MEKGLRTARKLDRPRALIKKKDTRSTNQHRIGSAQRVSITSLSLVSLSSSSSSSLSSSLELSSLEVTVEGVAVVVELRPDARFTGSCSYLRRSRSTRGGRTGRVVKSNSQAASARGRPIDRGTSSFQSSSSPQPLNPHPSPNRGGIAPSLSLSVSLSTNSLPPSTKNSSFLLHRSASPSSALSSERPVSRSRPSWRPSSPAAGAGPRPPSGTGRVGPPGAACAPPV